MGTVNLGQVAAFIQSVEVEELLKGAAPTVRNVGTKANARLVFGLPTAPVTMPLNPVCAYDMADISRGNIIKKLDTPLINIRTAEIIAGRQIYTAQEKGGFYRVHIESSFTGHAQPVIILYRNDWDAKSYILWHYCQGVQDFTVFIPQQNHSFGIGVWMHGKGDYQVQPDDSVNVYTFFVEALSDRVLVDSSGSGSHAQVSGGVAQEHNATVGTALSCMKGSIVTPPVSWIGNGKQWSHSRWIKIDENAQDKSANPRLWNYGNLDYCFFNIQANGGSATALYINTYKDDAASITVEIAKEKLITNKWVHLAVMTDLQDTFCRKSVYLNGEKVGDKTVKGDFSGIISSPAFFTMSMTADRNHTAGSLASLLFFDRLLTEAEVQWLYCNPYYPAKRYSIAEYKADENRRLIVTPPEYVFCFRGGIAAADLDKTVTSGIYTVGHSGYSGTLLVFNSKGSVGVVQFYKDHYDEQVPWKYRHALDGDTSRWTAWKVISAT